LGVGYGKSVSEKRPAGPLLSLMVATHPSVPQTVFLDVLPRCAPKIGSPSFLSFFAICLSQPCFCLSTPHVCSLNLQTQEKGRESLSEEEGLGAVLCGGCGFA
jgi:hypothetical protein